MRVMTRILSGVVAATLAAAGLAAVPAHAADSIVIWSDPTHAQVIRDLVPNGVQGIPVTVVEKDPANVRAELAGVGAKQAPDIIWGDLAWTGELADAGVLAPIELKKRIRSQFRPNVLVGSVVGGQQMGLPVQISNLALITNTALVPTQPRTFSELSDLALKITKKEKKVTIPFALAQGEGTSPWTTYPLFSGLGGYLFARSSDGSLDLADVGLSNKDFRARADLIDTWNSSGLVSSALGADQAKRAFARGKSPFWLAGPEELQSLLDLDFAYRIGSIPPIVSGVKPAPLLTVHGFMASSFAAKHGVEEQVKTLMTTTFAREGAQQKLAAASGQYPANIKAAETVATGGGRIRAIGNAGVDGVTMPNAPQAGVLWEPYALAWLDSTAGANATPAQQAFRTAQRSAVAALGGGTVPTE